MSFLVEITRRAEKDLDGLDRTTERQVRERLKQLAQDPYAPHLSQQVKMGAGERKSRVRSWRIFFEVDEGKRKIVILSIKHRKGAYK
ncbi:MAG: type II toxin-antitoxin system RelE family toxin [Thermodesulfobacteriota bacterium]